MVAYERLGRLGLEKDGERKVAVCMPGRKAFGYNSDKRNQMVFADV